MLPALGLPTADAGFLLLDMSRLDASGRFCARALLQALGWGPGHRVDLAVAGDAVVIGGSVTGRQTVGSRGELAVPAAARSLTGLAGDARVVLVAAVDQDVLVVHPHATVLQLLADHYAQQASENPR
jgi:bifunctional DNA-binding transcriptional regulator/antitoxin component of YhaV-PrlF toxin-antitoxin module